MIYTEFIILMLLITTIVIIFAMVYFAWRAVRRPFIKIYYEDGTYDTAFLDYAKKKNWHSLKGPAITIGLRKEYWIYGRAYPEKLFWKIKSLTDEARLAVYLTSSQKPTRTIAEHRMKELKNEKTTSIAAFYGKLRTYFR